MKLQDVTVIFSVMAIMLYSWGTAYYTGFLRYFGLDINIMERSFYQVLYNGFMASILPVSVFLIVSIFILLLHLKAILPTLRKLLMHSRFLKRVLAKSRKKLKVDIHGRLEQRIVELVFRFSACVLVILVVLGSLAIVESDGIQRAKRIHQQHILGQVPSSAVIKVKIDKKTRALTRLACGVRYCAGMETKTNSIYYFPHTANRSFDFSNGR